MNFHSGIPENWPTCKLGLCLCFNWSPVRNSIVDTFFNLPCLPSLSLASFWFNLNRPPLLRKLRDNSKYFTTQLSWKQRRREIYTDYREDRGLCCTIEVFRCFFFHLRENLNLYWTTLPAVMFILLRCLMHKFFCY